MEKNLKLPKKPKWYYKLHPDFPEEWNDERLARHVGVFYQNLVYTLENYSIFKNKVLLINGRFLK